MDSGQQRLNLARGQRAKIADLVPNGQRFNLGVAVQLPGLTVDVACFGLDGQGKLSDDRYMTFFNQPETPCGGVSLVQSEGDGEGFAFDLAKIPASIERLVITAAIDGEGAMSRISAGYVRFLDGANEAGRFAFTGADFADERALMLLEVYRKDGVWRTSALGQGFNGGLAALVKHFGGTLADDEPAPPPAPAPAPPPSATPAPIPGGGKLSLEKKVEQQAPRLVDLAKKASVSLEKARLSDVAARVGLVLDASGSMRRQYRQGRVQELVDRVLPLAVHFDDDSALDCWIFADGCKELPAARLNNLDGYVAREAPWTANGLTRSPIGGANNEPEVIREVIDRYRTTTLPAYVIFISDGGVNRNKEIERLIREAASLPIFWQFVGIGGRNYGILERLDTLSGRIVDNCSFFALDDLHSVSESELYDRLLNEFPLWLRQARDKGIFDQGGSGRPPEPPESSSNRSDQGDRNMSFQNFLSSLKQKASELKTEALKFKNKDFLNAAISGAVLISSADGSISSEEKQKMMRFIEGYEPLSVFTSKELIETFQNVVAQIDFDKDLGEAKAYDALRKMKSNDSAARLIMRMIICIAGADGNFDDSEKRVARKIAVELGLNAAEFELA